MTVTNHQQQQQPANMYSTSLLHDGPGFNKPLVETINPIQFKLKKNDQIATAFPIFH